MFFLKWLTPSIITVLALNLGKIRIFTPEDSKWSSCAAIIAGKCANYSSYINEIFSLIDANLTTSAIEWAVYAYPISSANFILLLPNLLKKENKLK